MMLIETINIKGYLFQKEIVQAVDFNDLEAIMTWSNSYERMHNYLNYLDKHPDMYEKEKIEGLRRAYVASDNVNSKLRSKVKEVFRKSLEAGNNHWLMSDEELEVYRTLPEQVTIYRGMTVDEAEGGYIEPDMFGVSWTLSKEKAEFFAYKYWRNHDTADQEKTVVELTVPRERLVAYFSERQEEEVIYIP